MLPLTGGYITLHPPWSVPSRESSGGGGTTQAWSLWRAERQNEEERGGRVLLLRGWTGHGGGEGHPMCFRPALGDPSQCEPAKACSSQNQRALPAKCKLPRHPSQALLG